MILHEKNLDIKKLSLILIVLVPFLIIVGTWIQPIIYAAKGKVLLQEYFVINSCPVDICNPFFYYLKGFSFPNLSYLDFIFFYPFTLINLVIRSNILSWAIWLLAISLFSYISIFILIYLFLKEVLSKKAFLSFDYIFISLLSASYSIFLPISMDGYYENKSSAAVIPIVLALYLYLFKISKDILDKSGKIKFLFSSCVIVILSSNIFFLSPRGFFVLSGLLVFILFSLFLSTNVKNKPFQFISTLFIFALSLIVSTPIFILTSSFLTKFYNLAAPVKDSIIGFLWSFNSTGFLSYPLNNSFAINFNSDLIFIILYFVAIFWVGFYLLKKKIDNKPLVIFTYLILITYLTLTNKEFASYATLNLPLGQLFREFRLYYYFGAFLLVFASLLFYLKTNLLGKLFITILLLFYILYSSFSILQNFTYVHTGLIASYSNVNKLLINNKDKKILWAPEMGWFGGTMANWMTENNGQGFPELTSTSISYIHYFNVLTNFYTFLASGNWRSQLAQNKNLSPLLSLLNYDYLAIHDDIKPYGGNVGLMKKNIATQNSLNNIFENDFITVYKNQKTFGKLWLTNGEAIICAEGYSCIADYSNLLRNNTLFLTDVYAKNFPNTSSSVLEAKILSSNNMPIKDIYESILINQILKNKDSNFLFAKDFFKDELITACPSDTHSGAYHSYLGPSEKSEFVNDYEFGNCFFLVTDYSEEAKRIDINTKLNKTGSYYLIVKYRKDITGSNFILKMNDKYIYLNGLGSNGEYYTYYNQVLNITARDINFSIINKAGYNMVSFIALVPKVIFDKQEAEIENKFKIVKKMSDQRPTGALNITKYSRSKIDFNLSSDSNIIINLPEPYDEHWVLKLTDSNGNSKIIKPFPGYGLINSFSVPYGNYKGEIFNTTTENFYWQLPLAAITSLILLIAFIFLGKNKRRK